MSKYLTKTIGSEPRIYLACPMVSHLVYLLELEGASELPIAMFGVGDSLGIPQNAVPFEALGWQDNYE